MAAAMDTALGWIGDLVRYFASWFPRPLIVLATHRAVKFVFGRRVKVLSPGFYWYIPAITEVYLLPVVEQTDDLPVQSGVTKDMKAVAIGGTICYRIYDVAKAAGQCFEISHIIRDRSMAVYNEFAASHTFSQILGSETCDDADMADETDPGESPMESLLEGDETGKAKPTRKKSGRHRVNTALTRRLRSCLRPYGVDVIRAQLTHFGPATTLVHVGHGAFGHTQLATAGEIVIS